MEISVVNIIISIVLLGSVVGSKARATTTAYLTQGTAYWTNYYVERNDWDMNKANVACASKFADKPIEWRSKYYWTAFCGLSGPSYPSSCGLCLKVTNPKNDASVVVRIVDQCGSESMDLDQPAFSLIDDGSGKQTGHLTVEYELVDCDPPPPPPAGPGETDVIAYWSDYGPLKNNWSYGAVACKGYDGNKPLEWRQRYGWTGYCGNVFGSQLKDICGKCLKVTNTRTKDEEIVRIVDTCGSGALELDLHTAFKPIDSDGKGNAAGHLTVDYQVVDCDDDVDSPLRLYGQ
ncbi:uncharacterized protein LOC120174185 [Hibiscus syriacus]|uniref:uncharacterized protein LOC120174185 n=1 Tax=Hibiscus syriacus TaxID=106335 RepID=UPI0019232523|nr:uncharacterized protein LOC120174185 [Hibiscus syriacus]